MAKSAAKTRSSQDVGTVESMAEPDRLAAISKVRIAYEGLAHLADRSEANRRRVRLLEVWRDLVTMREAEQTAPVEDAEPTVPVQDAEAIAPVHDAEPIAPLPVTTDEQPVEAIIPVAAESPVHEEVIEALHAPTSGADLVIADPRLDASHSEGGDMIEDVVQHVHGEDLVIAEVPFADQDPVEMVIADLAESPKTDVEMFRVRLRLIKPGLLHETLLAEGTIVSVFPADAEDLVNQGTAEIMLVQDDSDDD